jgi:formate dehydrogenase maturation protein FdhE
MKLHKCAICGKIAVTTPVLMQGKNGYRRYPICATCSKLKAGK